LRPVLQWRRARPRLGLTVALALAACARPAATADDSFAAARARMVTDTIASRDVKDARVLAAMRKVPRHEFVPANVRGRAYDDAPVPIGHGQTASQPYIVAVMTELAELGPDSRVLEIGTGSGYQAAVLAEVAGEVWSIELLEPLATSARRTLERLGYGRVHLRQGDGYRGWPEAAPFDAIVVTAAPPEVPKALLDQLAMGGRLVVPVGTDEQELEVHRGRRKASA
jgi:protein-L-isoaspartate(D-aspartate) O-methyltransferase